MPNRLEFNNAPSSKTFELVLCIRDSKGKPTNKKKYIGTDSAYKLWEFFNRNAGFTKRRKRKKTKQLPTAKEAEKTLKDMYKDKEDSSYDR
jgi:hypothetical protein